MPLIKSSSKEAVSKNISKEVKAGRPQKQAVAVALSNQRRMRAKGYEAGGLVDGGGGYFEGGPVGGASRGDGAAIQGRTRGSHR